MARPLRIEYPGAWYHVMNRGRRREKVYFSEDDYKLFMEILGECVKLFDIEIHLYSMMPNHYHLVVCTPKANLSRSIKHLNGVYAQKINRKYKTEGSLFRGRFKSVLIEKENYLLELARYIHRNPYKAKLEGEIGAHKWTSHIAYMKKKERPLWLSVGTVLGQFSQYKKEAQKKLDAFVKKEESKDLARILDSVKWPVMLGGSAFKKEIKEKMQGKKIVEKEIPQYKEIMLNRPVEEIIKNMKTVIREEGIFKRIKKRKYVLKRRALIYICRRYMYIPYSKIGDVFGEISSPAVSKQFRMAMKEIKKKEGSYWEFKDYARMLKLIVET